VILLNETKTVLYVQGCGYGDFRVKNQLPEVFCEREYEGGTGGKVEGARG